MMYSLNICNLLQLNISLIVFIDMKYQLVATQKAYDN